MKKAFLAVVILIVMIIGFFIIYYIGESKFDYKIEEIKQFQFYVYRENEQFGIINKDGQIIIQANYSNVIIPNPEKDIFICYKDETPEVINSKGEKLYTEYEEVKEVKLKNVASTLTYEKKVLIYKKDGLYGLMDFEGKVITKNLYDTIENLKPTEGKFLVSKDSKYGVIDLKGNILVDTKYDNIVSDEYYSENNYKKSGFIVSNKTETGYKYGYISYKGKEILETKYNEINRIPRENDKNIYLIASENGKYGLFKGSKNIIKNEFQSITYDENIDLLIIRKNKKYGVQAINGKTIVEIKYDEISSKGMYIYAKSGNEQKVYDINGKEIDMNFNKAIYLTENENYKISTFINNDITYYGIMDKNQNLLVPENYRYIEYLFKDYFIATDENGNLGIINSNGKIILDMKYSFVQRIKGKNIVQVGQVKSDTVEFYSENMEKVLSVSNANVELQDDFIIISNDEKKQYLDNTGKILNDTSKIQNINLPDKIGEYNRIQITVENVYYAKE